MTDDAITFTREQLNDLVATIKAELKEEIRKEMNGDVKGAMSPWQLERDRFERFLLNLGYPRPKASQFVGGFSGLIRVAFDTKRVNDIPLDKADDLRQFTDDMIELLEKHREWNKGDEDGTIGQVEPTSERTEGE